MNLFLQPDVLETLGLCVVWSLAGFLFACAMGRRLREINKDYSQQREDGHV